MLTVTCITAVKCILPLLFESPSYISRCTVNKTLNLEKTDLQSNISKGSKILSACFAASFAVPNDYARGLTRRFESTCLLNVLFEKKKNRRNSVRHLQVTSSHTRPDIVRTQEHSNGSAFCTVVLPSLEINKS